jgi:hypothetical protein
VKVLQRLRSMDADELRFRLACGTRKAADRARAALAPGVWRRSDLASRLLPATSGEPAELTEAREAARRGDWASAHLAFATHFATRQQRFPFERGPLTQLATRVRLRFPDARASACERADRMLAGCYDILGYRDLLFGTPPEWHTDPVHGREAPRTFWADVPYLDPRHGDHKVIWEINRHQHWLSLARAYHLSGDARYYAAVVEQLESWMAANPPLQGINWASMLELGFRSISWMWALHFFASAATHDRVDAAPWTVDLLLGLDRQLSQIERNLSQYFSPNTHLTGEALALYVTGCALPELRGSQRRTSIGRQVLLRQIGRQIHADGGHAELSAHYHRYTTDFYLLALLAARAAADPAATVFEETARRLAGYLRTLADDEGRLALLGDDDGGKLFPICGRSPWDCRDTLAAAAAILDDPSLAVSEMPEEVFWLCAGLPLEDRAYEPSVRLSAALADTGYYVSRTTGGDHLVFDAGHHGFLNGGHAHADALSIVLTVRGRPLLVDAGTGTYTMDPQLRDLFRSTAMHNTVVVNGRSQSQTRGAFHWHTVANARATLWHSQQRFDYAEGRHDGYRPIVHARGVLALHGLGWIVIDHLLGSEEATADAFWHVHPDWEASARDGNILFESSGSVAALGSSTGVDILSAADAAGLDRYAPAYGRLDRGTCLRARKVGALPRSSATFVTAAATRTGARHRLVSVQPLPLTEMPPQGWHGAAFRVSTGDRQVVILSAVEWASGSHPSDGPSRPWGCAGVQTDGRLAFLADGQPAGPAVVVGGTSVIATSTLASSVHRMRPAMAIEPH